VVLSLLARHTAALLPVLALLAIPAPLLAVAPPDSLNLARLQAACDSAWRVRVTGSRATYQLNRPRVEARGVQLEHADHPPALVTIGDPKPTERSNAGRGALVGFTLGAVVGGLTVAASGPDLEEDGDNAVLYAATLFTLTCATAGLLLGLANGTPTPLYP
jgi:hypothetical protein